MLDRREPPIDAGATFAEFAGQLTLAMDVPPESIGHALGRRKSV